VNQVRRRSRRRSLPVSTLRAQTVQPANLSRTVPVVHTGLLGADPTDSDAYQVSDETSALLSAEWPMGK